MTAISALQGLVLDAVLDDAALGRVAPDLARLMSAPSVVIQSVGPAGQFSHSAHFDPALLVGYQEHFWRHDLWINRLPADATGQVMITDWFIDGAEMLNSVIYNDLLRHAGGIFRCAGFSDAAPGGNALVVGVHQTRHRPFSEEQVNLLRGLKPALAGLINARARASSGRGRWAEMVADTEPDALMIVSIDRRLHYANRAALGLLEVGPLQVSAGRLVARDPALGRSLATALRGACAGGFGRSLTGLPGELRGSVDPLQTAADLSVVKATSYALLRVRDHAARRRQAASTAAATLGLTPAERRLAEALMYGEGPGEYARTQSVSLATVRTHLRSLYAKASVAGRPELLAKLATFLGS